MKKLHGVVCDNPKCRKFWETSGYLLVRSKQGKLHYCNEQCKKMHFKKLNS